MCWLLCSQHSILSIHRSLMSLLKKIEVSLCEGFARDALCKAGKAQGAFCYLAGTLQSLLPRPSPGMHILCLHNDCFVVKDDGQVIQCTYKILDELQERSECFHPTSLLKMVMIAAAAFSWGAHMLSLTSLHTSFLCGFFG